ncbi:unnamed protein product [Brachionus calyciflorus]|uniref:Uncharacterized protein n=1 Tax=Brachionus calyciflorus TaxID=104777 RepID=A0A813RHZ9_9BILA|nr:unnamed protein product [Brachionus calyciflorus]
MHRNIYVGLVVIPLLIALCLLLFSLQTEYWTSLDYSKIKSINSYDTNKFQLKKIKFEFPKYTSLFGECDEFKSIEILLPKDNLLIEPSPSATSIEFADEHIALRSNDYDRNGCISKEECSRLNQNESFSCFCCEKSANHSYDSCCFLKSHLCDGVVNCMDKSDEFENCPIRKLYYAHRYLDNKNKCLRHQYNLYTFFRKVLGRNFTDENDVNSDFCLRKLLKSTSYSVKIFVLRVLTLLLSILCVIFTVFCLISISFVSCCSDLPKANNSNDHLASEEDFEISTMSSSSKKKCNCLLCPFVFFSIFSFLSFLSCLIGLCIYLYSLSYARNVYLVYDPEFIPEHISQAYQYNAWLFDIQQLGASFYTYLASFLLYLLVLLTSTCLSCRIQLSPEWKNRHVNSYEVLQMHDIVLNGNAKGKRDSKQFKKLNREIKANEKEAKRIGKKYKNKNNKSDDGFSFSEESNALTSPKTRLTAMDDSYE